jgi:hypothetical protein
MRKFQAMLGKIGWTAAVTLLLATSAPRVHAITIDFSSVVGARVEFNGTSDTFSFIPTDPTRNQFRITGSDGTGDSVGLYGRMNGSFSIGAITTVGDLQTASVTGSGQLVVHDGSGYDLTGTLVWDSVSTFGSGGVINVNGSLNLSSLTYSGTRSDLLALAAPGVGSEVISFQFVPGKTLTELTTDGQVFRTSFSGSASASEVPQSEGDPVPDGGSSMFLLGASLIGISVISRRFSSQKA